MLQKELRCAGPPLAVSLTTEGGLAVAGVLGFAGPVVWWAAAAGRWVCGSSWCDLQEGEERQ